MRGAAAATAARTVICAKRRRIGTFCAPFHIGKLIAQARDPAGREFGRDRCHERVAHAGSGAVRQHVAGSRPRRRLQQAGNTNAGVAGNVDGLRIRG